MIVQQLFVRIFNWFVMIRPFLFLIVILFFHSLGHAQPKTDKFLAKILMDSENALLKNILTHKDSFRLQIIYTQIERDKSDRPLFRNFYFNVDSNQYFYPASTVKLPLALLALEKLNNLNVKGVNKFTPMHILKSQPWQTEAVYDSTSRSGYPSIAHYIKKIFLVSDNDAYNRLYQFVGQQTIHRSLREKGYRSIRIPRQFLGLTTDQNRYTNEVRFLDSKGNAKYIQPAAYNTDSIYFAKVVKIGNGYYDHKDSLIHKPFDFSKTNNIPLEDLQQILQSVLFPSSVSFKKRFNLSKDDEKFLLQYLSQFPAETNYPNYDRNEYYDSYVKYYFHDRGHQMPPHIRVFNKVGWAYGFLTDISYVVDFKNKVEFMLASTIYVNSDGIVNDDIYDYESIGIPFLYQLGQAIYNYELRRPRVYKPALKSFKMKYERRKPGDRRPTIKNVDN